MKNECQEELKEVSPFLLEIKKKTREEVSDAYFVDLPAVILLKKKKRQSRNFLFNSSIGIGIAASISLMILFSGNWDSSSSTIEGKVLSLEDFEDTEVLNYLGNNLSEIDPELLWDYSLMTEEQKITNDK